MKTKSVEPLERDGAAGADTITNMGPGGCRGSRPVLFACDENYAMPLATTLLSLAEANRESWPISVFILCDFMASEVRQRVEKSTPVGAISFHWMPVDLGRFGAFFMASHLSKMTFARLLIPELFASSVDKILYLDADLLVLENLQTLWDCDLQGAVIGAVLDRGLDPLLKLNSRECAKVPRVRDYFNAGVLLVDLHRWREERISERALEFLSKNPQSPFADQDALNVACDELWHRLPDRWNVQTHPGLGTSHCLGAGGIVHFVTKAKPWDTTETHPDFALYNAIRSRTDFFRTGADKLLDYFKRVWGPCRRTLRRSEMLRGLWRQAKSWAKRGAIRNGAPGQS